MYWGGFFVIFFLFLVIGFDKIASMIQIVNSNKRLSANNDVVQDIVQVASIEHLLHQANAWSATSIDALIESKYNHLLVVKEWTHTDETIIGYCLYHQLFEIGEVLRIGTHPNWQRQGIALRLLQQLIAILKADNVERLLLEVRADNTPAISLYNKLGFMQIDCRKGYYKSDHGHHVDALIMQLML